MNVQVLSRDKWKDVSEFVCTSSFGVPKDNDIETCDYALMFAMDGIAQSFLTCIEMNKTWVYWQYGGGLGHAQKNLLTVRIFHSMMNYCLEKYERITFKVENTNFAMIKVASKFGFLIQGISSFNGKTYLELCKERS